MKKHELLVKTIIIILIQLMFVFYINFNPKYFQRSDFKAGDLIEFIVTFLPNRLRADDPGGNHFINTKDDIYVD